MVARERARVDLNPIGKTADARPIARSQLRHELLGRLLHEFEVATHAHAAIEHHHDRDRLDLVREDRERLRLAVVVDLKHVARQIGNQPAARIRNGRIDGDRSYDILKRGLLRRGEAHARRRKTNRDECQPFHGDSSCRRRVLHKRADLAPSLLAGKFTAFPPILTLASSAYGDRPKPHAPTDRPVPAVP